MSVGSVALEDGLSLAVLVPEEVPIGVGVPRAAVTTTGVVMGQVVPEEEVVDIVPAGVVVQGGQLVLEAVADGEYASLSRYEAIMGQLSKLFSQQSAGDQEVLLAGALAKLKKVLGAVEMSRLLNGTELQRGALAEKQEKLRDSEEKIKQASEDAERASKSRKRASIFGLIGAIVSVVAGAFLCLVGAPMFGVMMLASGLLGGISSADGLAASKSKDGKGFLGEKGAIALTVVTVVLAVGSLAFCVCSISSTASMAAGKIADAAVRGATKVTSAVSRGATFAFGKSATLADDAAATVSAGAGAAKSVDAAGDAASTVKEAATAASNYKRNEQLVKDATNVVSGVAAESEIVPTTVGAVFEIEAADRRKEAADARASALEVGAFMILLDDILQQILSQLGALTDRFNAMASVLMEALNDRGETLGKVRLAG